MHRSDVEGHSRVPVTYMRLKQLFARKGMEYVVDILSNLVKLVSKQNLMGPNCLVFFSLYQCVCLESYFLNPPPPPRHRFATTSVTKAVLNNVYKLHSLEPVVRQGPNFC